jgi:hypothetical protein
MSPQANGRGELSVPSRKLKPEREYLMSPEANGRGELSVPSRRLRTELLSAST